MRCIEYMPCVCGKCFSVKNDIRKKKMNINIELFDVVKFVDGCLSFHGGFKFIPSVCRLQDDNLCIVL